MRREIVLAVRLCFDDFPACDLAINLAGQKFSNETNSHVINASIEKSAQLIARDKL
jgi:hypothetical protein